MSPATAMNPMQPPQKRQAKKFMSGFPLATQIVAGIVAIIHRMNPILILMWTSCCSFLPTGDAKSWKPFIFSVKLDENSWFETICRGFRLPQPNCSQQVVIYNKQIYYVKIICIFVYLFWQRGNGVSNPLFYGQESPSPCPLNRPRFHGQSPTMATSALRAYAMPLVPQPDTTKKTPQHVCHNALGSDRALDYFTYNEKTGELPVFIAPKNSRRLQEGMFWRLTW